MAPVPQEQLIARRAIIENELRWHEEEAHRRDSLDTKLYRSPAFDDVVDTQAAFLNMEAGNRLLEMGSGPGKETLYFSQQGQRIVTFDLSYVQLASARKRVLEKNPDAVVFWVQANAEELPFAPDSFDAVYGKAILHHLDLDIAANEVKRVLRPGGRATFAEPMAWHPLIWLGRRLTPQLRTRDEHPLRWSELEKFNAQFRSAEMDYFYILSPLALALRFFLDSEKLVVFLWHLLNGLDRRLLRHLRPLRSLAWYSLVFLRK